MIRSAALLAIVLYVSGPVTSVSAVPSSAMRKLQQDVHVHVEVDVDDEDPTSSTSSLENESSTTSSYWPSWLPSWDSQWESSPDTTTPEYLSHYGELNQGSHEGHNHKTAQAEIDCAGGGMGGLGNLFSMFKNMFGGGNNNQQQPQGGDEDQDTPAQQQPRRSGYEAEVDAALEADTADAEFKGKGKGKK